MISVNISTAEIGEKIVQCWSFDTQSIDYLGDTIYGSEPNGTMNFTIHNGISATDPSCRLNGCARIERLPYGWMNISSNKNSTNGFPNLDQTYGTWAISFWASAGSVANDQQAEIFVLRENNDIRLLTEDAQGGVGYNYRNRLIYTGTAASYSFSDTHNGHFLLQREASGNISLYMNGALFGTTSTVIDGKDYNDSDYIFDREDNLMLAGAENIFDELCLFNDSLTENEINLMYNQANLLNPVNGENYDVNFTDSLLTSWSFDNNTVNEASVSVFWDDDWDLQNNSEVDPIVANACGLGTEGCCILGEGCLDFEGEEYLDGVDFPSFGGYTDLSISYWIYYDLDDSGDRETAIYFGENNKNILSRNSSEIGEWEYYYTEESRVLAPYSLDGNTWYHIVALKDGDRLELWVNGDFKTQSSNISIFYDNNTGDFLGAGYDPVTGEFGNYMDGSIDQLSIWDRELTYPEIFSLYNYGTGIDPVESYQCNDGTDNDGDNLTDYPNDPGCYSPIDNSENTDSGGDGGDEGGDSGDTGGSTGGGGGGGVFPDEETTVNETVVNETMLTVPDQPYIISAFQEFGELTSDLFTEGITQATIGNLFEWTKENIALALITVAMGVVIGREARKRIKPQKKKKKRRKR